MNAAYDCNMLAGPPLRECFEEASIDDSCTFPVDEGAATFCVGTKHSDVQETAWIAVGVLGAVVLALVTIFAVGTVWYTRQ